MIEFKHSTVPWRKCINKRKKSHKLAVCRRAEMTRVEQGSEPR
jgi:hypothetical protein